MILEQRITALLQCTVNDPRKHPEHRWQEDLQAHFGLLDVDRRGNGLPHGGNVEVQLIADPACLHLGSPWNVLLEAMDVACNPAPSLILAEIVRKIDFDRLTHSRDVDQCSALFKLQHGSMLAVMKLVLSALALVLAPFQGVAAQTVSQGSPALQPSSPGTSPSQTLPSAANWDPAAQYITVGQDEPGYRSWYLSTPAHAIQVKAFNDYLTTNQVEGVLPTWQLLRTATAWQECGAQPFEVPPTEEWQHMVQTLRYVRDYVIPAVGPVEPVSVYRNPQLNKCAGGAPESAHRLDSAIDMVPLRPTTREALMKTLCGVHSEHGAAYNAGLGFYAYLRFHVDSTKFRRWNMDPAVAADCPAIIHPEDIASVGQPLPPSPAPLTTPASIPLVAPGPTAPQANGSTSAPSASALHPKSGEGPGLPH